MRIITDIKELPVYSKVKIVGLTLLWWFLLLSLFLIQGCMSTGNVYNTYNVYLGSGELSRVDGLVTITAKSRDDSKVNADQTTSTEAQATVPVSALP